MSIQQQLNERNANLAAQYNHYNHNQRNNGQQQSLPNAYHNPPPQQMHTQQQQFRQQMAQFQRTMNQQGQRMAQQMHAQQQQFRQHMAEQQQQLTQQMAQQQQAMNRQAHQMRQFNRNDNYNGNNMNYNNNNNNMIINNGNSLSVRTRIEPDGTHVYVNRNGQNTHYVVQGRFSVQNGTIVPQHGANVRVIGNENHNNRNHNENDRNNNDNDNDNVHDLLPIRNITSEEAKENMECRICMENLKQNDTAKTLPCFHQFHDDCVSRWLRINPFCPLCRYSIHRNQFNP